MKEVLIVVYLLLLLGVLLIILLKVKNKKKIHPVLFIILGVLILLPVLYFLTIGSFSDTIMQPEIKKIEGCALLSLG